MFILFIIIFSLCVNEGHLSLQVINWKYCFFFSSATGTAPVHLIRLASMYLAHGRPVPTSTVMQLVGKSLGAGLGFGW